MNKKNSFKSSLSVPIFEAYNKSIFNLLRSKPYENYTDVVLSTLGKELENYFSPSDFRLKYRYKVFMLIFQKTLLMKIYHQILINI